MSNYFVCSSRVQIGAVGCGKTSSGNSGDVAEVVQPNIPTRRSALDFLETQRAMKVIRVDRADTAFGRKICWLVLHHSESLRDSPPGARPRSPSARLPPFRDPAVDLMPLC